MGFDSGSVAFRRYRVSGFDHENVDEAMLDALNANSFGTYGTAVDESVEFGWITSNHLFDVNFAGDKIAVGRFAYFRMRMDKNSVPGSILRSYIQIEEQAALEVAGREYLSKQEKREAKDAAKRRADKEARSGAFRRIAAHSVLLDMENRVLYFGNTGNAANDALHQLFGDTFNSTLEPIDTQELAAQVAVADKLQRAFEDARPDHLVSSPEGVDPGAYNMDPTDRSFLGREFLSWLLYHCERGEGMFAMPTGEVGVCVDKMMQLKCDFNMSGSDTIRGDGPGRLPETRAALASGKQPVKSGLMVSSRLGEWTLTLDAATMNATGVVLPPSEEEDAQARVEERFEHVADLANTIDGLFEKFLRIRLSGKWPATLGEMKEWAEAGRVELKSQKPQLALA